MTEFNCIYSFISTLDPPHFHINKSELPAIRIFNLVSEQNQTLLVKERAERKQPMRRNKQFVKSI